MFRRPWQDWVLAACEVVFMVSLVPLLWSSKNSVPAYVAFPTAIALFVVCVPQVSYRNWLTTTLTAAAGSIWLVVGLGVRL